MVWWAKKQNEKEGGNIQIWSNSRNIQVTQEFTARFNKVKAEGKQRVLSGLTSFSRVVSWDGWYFSLSWGVFLSIFSRSVFSLRSAPLGLKKKQDVWCKSWDLRMLKIRDEHEVRVNKVLYLKDFDLAAGWVDMLDVFSVFIGGVSVHLDSEGHPFLPAVLPGGELGADAVDLKGQENREELKNKFS